MNEWKIKSTIENGQINSTSRFDLLNNIIESKTITLNKQILNSINLNEDYYLKQLNNNLKFYEYFSLLSGTEHYRLLVYMSLIFNNSNLFDIGTCGGTSALALSSNPSNTIYSFDIQNIYSKSLNEISNIHFFTENILEQIKYHKKLLSSPFIFLDTQHDGIFEQQFYDFLINNNYKGILGLDDIHLNIEMETFWNNIITKKEDVTKYGHGSGTGFVIFNDIKILLE